jgi:amino acid adenylation domain-containing protein
MTDGVFVFPVSFAQQRLWFLDQLEPGSALYNVPDVFEFPGPVDRSILAWCLNEIVRRHEALRTTFASLDGQPVQVVLPALIVPLPEADLRRLPEQARAAEATRLASEEYERPFDLEHGPLLRVLLLRLSDDTEQLVVTMHHIVSDGWSLDVFGRELRALYDARTGGAACELPPLAIQYADFAVWQRTWLSGEVLDSQLAYWTRQLRSASGVLALPTDRPRPAIQSFRGASQQIRLPRALADALKALSHREGVTVFMCLLGAFSVLLHRYTGQDDLVVGTPVAGRTRAETAPLIGFFVNALALTTDLSGDPSFQALLARVREVALGAYAHQDLPFEKLVEALQPARSLSYHPIFQVMFQVLPASPTARDDGGERDEVDEAQDEEPGEPSVEEPLVETGTAKFDLSMDVLDVGDGFIAGIEYSTELFDHTTIQRMLASFRTLLEDVVADPTRPISRLSMLAPRERQRVLHQWNGRAIAASDSDEAFAHELFERQVAVAPDRTAVVSEAGALTYGDLNIRANRLAHCLQRAGVGPESVVALCVDRSLDMLVGLLGILKAGAAYLPLDPAYPRQRLAFMLEDAGVRTLVTQAHWLDTFPAHRAHALCLDRDWSRIELESPSNAAADLRPQHLAYVIYTSGSTGQPKGVMIQHRSLARWIPQVTARYELRSDDRILQFSSLSFDTAAEEIFPCLALGATLHLRTTSMATSIADFLHRCREWKITVLDLPTAYWHELAWEVASRDLALPPSIRLVIVGGERALPGRVAMWHRATPSRVRLMQGYGPTETTIVATIADLSPLRHAPVLPAEVPIGHVIDGAQAYVLDRHQQPAPVGVTGELYIGGDLLARGYLHRPAPTAERFIPDPFGDAPGGRLYRTGDLVRRLADGQMEFLGRCDKQVKIRGHRIELGEIESAVKAHPGVRDAVVVAREEADGKRVAVYVVADRADAFAVSALRETLRDRLPDYMMPSSITRLDALPLSPSGKIDRRSLPEPSTGGHDLAGAVVAPPRTETERLIASIWQEVFKADVPSVHANFFDLGGHSLTLVRVRSRLRDHFGDEISMVDMFRYPTISALADHVSRNGAGHTAAPPTPAPQLQARAEKQKSAYVRRKQLAQGGK